MSVERIRNIAFIGQSGAGKTSLVERLLFETGDITSQGELARGTTVTDFDPQSIAYQHSVEATPVNLSWHDTQLNIIDTPGLGDLLGRSISVFPAIESVALVTEPHAGVGNTAEQLFNTAKSKQKCRLIVVNKIDAEDAASALPALMDQLQASFGAKCLPINLPDPSGHQVVDCYFKPDYDSDTLFSSVEEAHDQLVDQVVEVDEELMELYLEQGQALKPEQLHDAFEAVLREDHLIPVCFVSARTGAGLNELLHILSELMPTPLEGNPPQFYQGEKAVSLSQEEGAHAVGHVFKVSVDPYMGRVAFIRVFQGEINAESMLFIGSEKKAFKVGHLYRIQGKQRSEISKAVSGDICAIAKVDELDFDCVVHDSHDEDGLHLTTMDMPAPMFSLAVSPARRGDEQKLSEVLKKLCAEDPSLRLRHRVRQNETLLTGVGEFHLKIVLEKALQLYKLEIDTTEPSIDYRETITGAAEAVHRHKKQTGGAGQFGEVHLRVRALGRGEGFRFVNKVVGGAIPTSFIPAVEKGIRQILDEGAIAGFPLQDIEVEVFDGKHHSVDSKEIAFVTAGRKAFLEAIDKAGPIILEPIVDMQIQVPSEFIGDITGDLSGHRGMVTDSLPQPSGLVVIQAKAPLSELQDYARRMKSMTRGEGSFSMSLSHFETVPMQVQKGLVKAHDHPVSA